MKHCTIHYTIWKTDDKNYLLVEVWNREEWLNFIKDVIAVYKELLKLEH